MKVLLVLTLLFALHRADVTVDELYGNWISVSCELITATPIPVYVFRNITYSNTTFEAFFTIHIEDATCGAASGGSCIHAQSIYSLGIFDSSFGAQEVNGNFTLKTQLFFTNTLGPVISGGYDGNYCWANYTNHTTTQTGVVYNILPVNCPSLSLLYCPGGFGDWANISNGMLYLGTQSNYSNCAPNRPPALNFPLQRPPPPTPAPTPAPIPPPTPAPTLAPTPAPTPYYPVPTPKVNFGISTTPASMIAIIFTLLLCALF